MKRLNITLIVVCIFCIGWSFTPLGVGISTAQKTTSENSTAIQTLLKKARKQVSKKKLTTPYRDNAYETLQKVLKLDPQNGEVSTIIETIKKQYLVWIEAAEKDNKIAYARLFCYRYLIVDPDNEAILSKLEKIAGGKISEKDNASTAGKKLVSEMIKQMILIPGGDFVMGSKESWPPDRHPAHTVTLPNYYIDKYETTNAEFVAFLNSQGNPESAYINVDNTPFITTNGNTFTVLPGKENYPVSFVSWYGADAYCRWQSKRLPTEAEWEKAARGPSQLKYPWGLSEPNSENLNFTSESNWMDVLKPVGLFEKGMSPFGVFDMAGNVWEWCADWYDARYYQASPAANPIGGKQGEHRILRGGQVGTRKLFLETTYRNHNVPGLQSPYTGCRCALTDSE